MRTIVERLLTAICCVLAVTTADAQLSLRLDPVTVTARRPMRDIGVEATRIDSAALKENIALSMADVIGFNSSVFVKTSGRATLSTLSFRGTAPSHTEVRWNGLPVNSPALGMTDFSLLPSYFVDRASLLHGPSAAARVGGAIGGMVDMTTTPADIPDGWRVRYVQGAGSFMTFDEFLQLSHGSDRWRFSTRAVYSSSRNDFSFVNHDRKENVYDDNHQIVSQYYPREKNRNGSYGDLHILQQVCFTPRRGHTLGLDLWYTNSQRRIPLTTVDYMKDRRYRKENRENTLRSVLSYVFVNSAVTLRARAGYVHTHQAYDYAFALQGDAMRPMTRSRTTVNTFHATAEADWRLRRNLHLNAVFEATRHGISAADLAALAGVRGYSESRWEENLGVTLRWQPREDVGLSAVLREAFVGGRAAPLTPAVFADWTLWRPANLVLKASFARNFHAPTLNDLYFLPGGNPDLLDEKGLQYDVAASASGRVGRVLLGGSVAWFDSFIDNWILWLPTNKGFFSPRNVRRVRASGVEASANMSMSPFREATLDVMASFARTASVNRTPAHGQGDASFGRQLPYVPLYSASASVRLEWRRWELLVKTCHYSRRYTMTSNEAAVSGSLPPYFMTNMSLGRSFPLPVGELSAKLVVNNLFDADYQTVLSHPMPGANFEIFIGYVF